MKPQVAIRQAARWFTYQLASRAIILMYHRVAELPNDPHLLAVRPRHFADQLEVIRRYCHPLPLSTLAQALQKGNVARRAVAVTFDDGYADNLSIAKPLLERYDIPATVFVTTGQIGSMCEFWWDELDRLLLQPGTLPPTFELCRNGCKESWQLDDASTYSNADYRRDRQWHVEHQDDPTPRHRLFRALYERLHASARHEREQLLEELRTWAGAERNARSSHRTLSQGEVLAISEDGLVEIGAHTVSHPALAALSKMEQRNEIRQSKTHLQQILNRPVLSFAYPHGSYTSETLALVREAGFYSACCSDTALIEQGSDGFRLPRIVVRDWDGDQFARCLCNWLRGRN